MPALCESRYHTYNDYRHKDLSVIKSEKSEKGARLLEKIIIAIGVPLVRKKTINSCKLKKLPSRCLTYTACYIVLLFILSHKNRNKREAMRKAGEPVGNNRDIAIKAGSI